MPIATRLVLAAALFVALSLPATASAQNGPAGKNSWLTFRGEAVSNHQLSLQLGSGVTVEWGQLQNQFFGGGARLGFTRNDGALSLLLLTVAQAHIALGENVILMPTMLTGMKLSEAAVGFYIGGGLGLAARFDTFFVGAEGEIPIFTSGLGGNRILPGFYSLNLLGGFYF